MSRPLPPGVPDILARIVVTKHEEVAAARARRSLSSLREEAESRTDLRDFEAALRTKIAAAQPAVMRGAPRRRAETRARARLHRRGERPRA